MAQRILSWNVNGIRSCVNKGFLPWLGRSRADIVCLQETRVSEEQLPEGLRGSRTFPHFSLTEASSRKGYSGVGLFSRKAPEQLTTSLGRPRFDREGRFQLAQFPDFLLANVYFPNGSGKDRDNSRVSYKLSFTRRVFDLVDEAREQTGLPAVILGDFNTAPAEIDLARPKENRKTSGFLPEECRALSRCLKRGYVDTFRHLHPEEVRYSWWSSRFGVRAKNIGWRIDLILVSEDLVPRLKKAFVLTDVMGSDHCPIGIELG